MYTRQEASQLRQAFWTTFGKYMSPILSADGAKINWINYKTGIKHIRFTMEADTKQATIAIVIDHPDAATRKRYYQQLVQLQGFLHETLGEQWNWQEEVSNEYGQLQSIISKELKPANIFDQQQWPVVISFFKPRIMALDECWSMAKEGFER
ncbi:DUF4268 domain-containing protein [Chitinophaga horti]|uniref:DUF4268 domain-containing protein n=1 Tax=Chitinophaga horti TaxID=2920382 RepID=A0ABY6J6V2_9BACT|nr:DUF4268 domain-containing protein [Chitinophaga horti]UYQ95322.1 DUF4268 domain-containing protein [Chitinophaga horti]